MSPTTGRVPRELVDVIIEELVDDRSALFACSLTSTVFHKIARKHIFREIALSFDNRKPSQAEILSQILFNNSALSLLVESLIVHLDDLQSALQSVASLHAFKNARKLTLSARSEYTDWRMMPEALRDALSNLLQQPSLQCLALKRQNHFPIDWLLHCPNITGLSIEASSTERFDPPSTSDSTKRTILPPHLQSFFAVIYGDNGISLGAVQDTFKVFAPSLTDVTLDCLGYEDGLPPRELISECLLTTIDSHSADMDRILSFRRFANLGSLKLVLRIHGSTMLLIPFRQSLETLSQSCYDIRLELYIRYLKAIGEPYTEHWNELDHELCRLLDTSVIGSLKVVLSSYWADEEGLAALRDSMTGLDSRLCIHTISGSQEFL
ncbi:hypothetical protein H0H87_006980 [Tephrocybe sp. NHM501043]|nr:hypothetical protein H0H87_006980 [Tephrocybe sp. NHM501043]